MKSSRLWIAVSLAAGLTASSAAAQHYQQGGCGCPAQCGAGVGGYGYAQTAEDACIENSIWPKQYVTVSRRGICQAFGTMIDNGWRHHNLLSKYHFDPESGDLSEAGRLKAEWTLTQAPAHRRNLFVERGADQDQTAQRLAAVETFAAGMSPAMPGVDVQETHIRDEGHPAGGVDAVFTGFRANQAPPMLPQAGSSPVESGQ